MTDDTATTSEIVNTADHPDAGPLAWLTTVCSTEEYRLSLSHPWTIQHAGAPWTVATDGKVLVARLGDAGFPPADQTTPAIGNLLAQRPDVAPAILALAPLRALAMPWIAENLPTCTVCSNTGTFECAACDGNGSTECECDCGDEHERRCADCDGKGMTACADCPIGAKDARDPRPVWIGAGLFDLRLFARVLPHVAGETARVRQPKPDRAAYLEIGDWWVVVMPMNPACGGEELKNAPRLALGHDETLNSTSND